MADIDVDVDRDLWQGRVPVAFAALRLELPAEAPQTDPFYVCRRLPLVSLLASFRSILWPQWQFVGS